jgi:hypothetical protein
MITKYGAQPSQVHREARQDDEDNELWHHVDPRADTEKIVRKSPAERTTVRQAKPCIRDKE